MGVHAHYRPNAAVLRQLGKVDFVALIGPTAAGKSTLAQMVLDRDPALHWVRTTTSRPIRAGERDGELYHFRSEEELQKAKMRGEFVQVAPNVFGPIYATRPEDYSAEGISIMAVIASAMPDYFRLPFKRLRQICILPPDAGEWQRRIALHGFSKSQMRQRMEEARVSLQYVTMTPGVLFLCNDDADRAAAELLEILHGQPPEIPAEKGIELAQKLQKSIS